MIVASIPAIRHGVADNRSGNATDTREWIRSEDLNLQS